MARMFKIQSASNGVVVETWPDDNVAVSETLVYEESNDPELRSFSMFLDRLIKEFGPAGAPERVVFSIKPIPKI